MPGMPPIASELEVQGRFAGVRATCNGGWDEGRTRGSFGIMLDDLPEPGEI